MGGRADRILEWLSASRWRPCHSRCLSAHSSDPYLYSSNSMDGERSCKTVTWHYVCVGLGFLPSQGSTSDMRGIGDSDCVLGRMGLLQVLLVRQVNEYPASPSSDTENNFAWFTKTGNVRINIEARSCRHFCRGKAVSIAIFRYVIPVVFYLQLNRRSFESKHNYLMLLSSFKLTTCFGPCTGLSSGHKIYN